MNIGTLTIEMAANVARLQNDMEQAKQVVSSSMDHINKAVDVAKSALGSLGAVTSIVGFGALVEKTIQAAAEMHRMAERTGVTVEALSALRGVAKMSGTNMDDVATAMQKLSRNMVEAQSGSGKTAEAMKMLGISVQDSSGHLKTADQVTLEVAKSLAQYQDGAGKTAVVMNVFGKAGANLLPMLAELAEKGNLNGKMTSEQAKQAYEFEKALNKLKMQFEGVFKSIALDLIPVITKLSQLFTTGIEVAAAYWAIFYGLPAAVALGTAALGSLQMTVALVKLEMAQGATVGSLFAASLGGIVGPAQWAAGALGKLQVAAGVLLAAFAGWEIGKWLSENFSWARQAGLYMVYGLIEAWEAMKFAAQIAWTGIKAGAVSAFEGVATAFAWVYEKIANGLKAIGADGMAKSLTNLSERLRSGAVSTSSLKDEVAQITEEYNKNRAALNADIDAQLAYERAGKGAVAATKEQKKELQEIKEVTQGSESDYSKFTKSINEKIAAVQAEIAAGHVLNAAEQARVKLLSDLKDGTVKMTAAEILAAKAKLDLYESQLKVLQSQQEIKRYQDEIIAKSKQVIDAAVQEAGANENLAATYGMTKLQIAEVELARLQAQMAQRSDIGMTLQEIDSLEKLIDAKKRSAAALSKLEGYEAAAKAAKDASDAWQRAADDINQSLSKAIMKGFTGTKGFITDFMNQLKGLFSKLILQPIISPISGAIASLMVPNAAQAQGGGSGALGLASNGMSIYSGLSNFGGMIGNGISSLGTMAGSSAIAGFGSGLAATAGADTGLAAMYASAAAAGNLSAGAAAGGAIGSAGSGAMASASSALGAIPVIGWIALAAAAAAYFGAGKDRELTGVGLSGQLGTQNITRDVSWTKDGGWFNSDTSGTWKYKLGDSSTVVDGRSYTDSASQKSDQSLLKTITDQYDAMKKAAADYAKALGLDASYLTNRTQDFSINLGTTAEEMQKNVGELFKNVGNDISNELLSLAPGLAELKKAGESSSDTIARLATDISSVNDAMKTLGQSTYKLDAEGISAAENLVKLYGGLQNLQTVSAAYYDKYYTDAEKAKIVTSSLTAEFQKIGVELPKSLAQLREWIDAAKALGTEAGDKTYVALMQLTGAFANLQGLAGSDQAKNADLQKQRQDMVLQIMEEQGLGLQALNMKRQQEIALMDESLRPLARQLDLAQQEKAARELANRQANMQVQILDLEGKTAEAAALKHKLEIAATEEGLRPQAERIYQLQQEAAALDVAKQHRALDIELMRALGNEEQAVAAERADALKGMDAYSQAISQQIWAAQAAKDAMDKAKASSAAEAQRVQVANQVAEQSAAQAQQEYDKRLSAAKSALQTAYNAEASALQNVISKMQSFGTAARAMQESMISSGISPESTASQYARMKADMPSIVAAAKEGDQGSLAKLQKFVELSQQSNSDFVDYVRDFATVQNVLDESASNAERLVKQNQSQLDLLKSQVDGLLNVNNSVMSVGDAIKALQDVMAGGLGDVASALNGQYKAKNPSTTPTTTTGMTADQIYGGLPGEGDLQAKRAAAIKLNSTLTDKVQQYIEAQYEKEAGYNPGNAGNQYYMDLNAKYFGAGAFEKYARELGIFAPSDLPTASMLPVDGSHANGLERVPFDNYIARLHKGERVQTASQVSQESELIGEIRLMRAELRAVVSNTKDTYKTLDRWTNVGLPATETA